MIEVQPYETAQRETWDALVRRSQGTFLHERAYMDYHADRFPDASVLLCDRGKNVAVLPATRTGSAVTSHAGLTYGGLLQGGLTSANVLECFDAVNAHYAAAGVTSVEYKPVPYIYSPTPFQDDLYALFRLNADLVARGLAASISLRDPLPYARLRKRGVRSAEKAGYVLSESDDYAPFWSVLAHNLLSKYGAVPVHTLEEILLLHARFPDRIRLYIAERDGICDAGCVIYDTGRVVHAQYSSATPAGLENGALDALFDHTIRLASARPSTDYYDFGTSTEAGGRVLNEALAFRKEGFGGRGVVYDTYRYALPAADIQDANGKR